MRVRLLKATLCSSSTATLVKGRKSPRQSGCTMVCGSIDAIRLAEAESLRNVFPGITEQEPIFKIVSLAAHFARLQGQLDSVDMGPPLLPELPRRFRPYVTPQHSPIYFQQKRVDPRAEERQDQYIERVSKRPRL